MINFTQRFGDPLQAQIVVKRTWLQSLPLLSYHAAGAYDINHKKWLSSPRRYQLTEADFSQLGQMLGNEIKLNKLVPFINKSFSNESDFDKWRGLMADSVFNIIFQMKPFLLAMAS